MVTPRSTLESWQKLLYQHCSDWIVSKYSDEGFLLDMYYGVDALMEFVLAQHPEPQAEQPPKRRRLKRLARRVGEWLV